MQLVHIFSQNFSQRPPLLQLIHSWINCIFRYFKMSLKYVENQCGICIQVHSKLDQANYEVCHFFSNSSCSDQQLILIHKCHNTKTDLLHKHFIVSHISLTHIHHKKKNNCHSRWYFLLQSLIPYEALPVSFFSEVELPVT